MSVTVRMKIKVKDSSRVLHQSYELPDRHIMLLIYGANIPACDNGSMEIGTILGALTENDGRVGFFPLAREAQQEMPHRILSLTPQSSVSEVIRDLRPPFHLSYPDVEITVSEVRRPNMQSRMNSAAGRRGGRV